MFFVPVPFIRNPQPLEQIPAAPKQLLQGGHCERLTEAARAGQKEKLPGCNHSVQIRRLVHIFVAVLYQTPKLL